MIYFDDPRRRWVILAAQFPQMVLPRVNDIHSLAFSNTSDLVTRKSHTTYGKRGTNLGGTVHVGIVLSHADELANG